MDTEKEVQNFLKHYGKKGMKWGVTNESPSGGLSRSNINKVQPVSGGGKPTSAQIKEARQRHNDRAAKINTNDRIGISTLDKATQAKVAANIRKLANEPGARQDASIGAKLTRGERAATYLAVGPFAPLVNRKADKNREAYVQAFLDAASSVKVTDFVKATSG